MRELLVVLSDDANRDEIRALATVVWESELLPVISVTVAEDKIASLRAVRGVVRIESPKLGSVMV